MNRTLFFATLLYSVFVIYGSLVPLEFKGLPLDAAISKFKKIPYLDLGPESRADWIANIILYIPLALMASATFERMRPPLTRIAYSVGIAAYCLLLAVAIEFSQLFFPPRTVSLNDLIAETLGTFIGILGWQFFGSYFSHLYSHLLRGSLLSVQAAIIFYLLIYVGLSLFPFDFVTSFDEVTAKLDNGYDAAVISFDACGTEPVRCGVKLVAEILVLLPVGFLFCYLPYLTNPSTVAVLTGLFLGVTIETTQVFLLSGSGQGISVLTRMIGMGAGAKAFKWANGYSITKITDQVKRVVWLTVPPYLLLVLSINGWFSNSWLSAAQAMEKLAHTRFLPLYYFYYTSEGVALVSLLSNLGMYLPIGALFWVRSITVNQDRILPAAPHWSIVGLIAAFFALIIETSKLFLSNKHADPSDIWLAFIAAAGFYTFLNHFLQWLKRDKTLATLTPIEQGVQHHIPATVKPTILQLTAFEPDKRWRIVSFLLWTAIAIVLFTFPTGGVWLGIFLIAYSIILHRYPYVWLVAIPGLLPLMDFAPWTGRFYLDEFDLLILATLAFYFWHKPNARNRSLLSMPTMLLLTVYTVLFCASLLKGLLPLQTIDANSFTSYYSSYNSLRVGKGFLWSLLLIPLLQLTIRRYRFAPIYFGYGVLFGLVGVIVASVWERIVFTGLFDLSNEYRIIALFSSMHTGGGEIDAYLALTLPFIALLFFYLAPPSLSWPFGLGLCGMGLYVVIVTFSRGAYLAIALDFVVLASALMWSYKNFIISNWRKFIFVPFLLAIIPVGAWSLFQGAFIKERFHQADSDFDRRITHWKDAVNMMANDLPTYLIGMGIGSYPRTYLWLNEENITPAMYRISSENGNAFLKLSPGKDDSLFMGQQVAVQPHTLYRLSLDLRGHDGPANLSISLCEKSLLYSVKCSWAKATQLQQSIQWDPIELEIDSGDVGEPVLGGLSKRPIQLSLSNSTLNTIVDADNISLTDSEGNQLISNGNFEGGTDFWLFSTDNHWPWHIENLAVQILFEQGWLGVSCFFMLFAKAIFNCCRRLKSPHLFAPILLSSFSGFMLIGLLDSPFDYPRITLLFFLLLYLALMRTPQAWRKI